jgi:hypothetical protein
MTNRRSSLPGLLTGLCVATFALNARLVSRFHVSSAAGPAGTADSNSSEATRDGNGTGRRRRSSSAAGTSDKDRPDSFSSCLLWMDDSFRMPEWLAYHYYVMNLRYLVLHPDPRSKTSPGPVLDRWRDRIHIVEWTDPSRFTNATYFEYDDVESDDTTRDRTPPKRKETQIWEQSELLVQRQLDFYQACAMHMRSQNRTWTSFHDNDEFLVVVSETIRGHRESVKVEPGMALKVVERYSRGRGRGRGMVKGGPNPTDASGLARDATRYETHRDWDLWFSALPCVVLPRALLGAVASPDADVERNVPAVLDAHRFDTLRWRVQGTVRDDGDGPGKAIVDVSRLPASANELASRGNGTASPHRPFGELCTNGWPPSNGLPLAFHHYLGSWEEFSFRDDIRKGLDRSHLKWTDKSSLDGGGVNDDARSGILGFVEMVGESDAVELLRDAGLPRGYVKAAHETRDWDFIGSVRSW